MAHFAKKTIDSPTRQRLQRHADSLPNVKGIVKQHPAAGTDPGGYTFTGSARSGMQKCDGTVLGPNFASARLALDLLNTPKPRR